MNWIELIVFILLTILFFALAYDNLRVRMQLQKSAKQLTQQLLDYNAIVEKFQEELKKSDNKKIEETEGFVKFLADSRESAFAYIESVQKALRNLKIESNKVDLASGYLLAEELQDLRKVIAEALRELPADIKND